ncbi:MAG: hypothetical protein CMF38_07535 [Legionellaceae bacterium]|nr:hypothetical protein [Legionellaceae bacterium]MBJ16464.1 hypothetical protein [Legionellaceae bacterium]HAF87464.1 hypothetical protein [Legionellales bacterium]HCA89785.1 hypothetical protein [Legionellales bacterium]|tara:strand:+ start:551 stop:853 length:303 start_codon:yes stop_codon:yes gene_type:complete
MSHKPTQAMAKNAEKGLNLHQKFDRGGTQVGFNRAKQLKHQENLSDDVITKMYQYFRRHEVDKKAENFGNDEDPSAGYIAWLLWGGDEGYEWVTKLHDEQ